MPKYVPKEEPVIEVDLDEVRKRKFRLENPNPLKLCDQVETMRNRLMTWPVAAFELIYVRQHANLLTPRMRLLASAYVLGEMKLGEVEARLVAYVAELKASATADNCSSRPTIPCQPQGEVVSA